MSEHKYYRYDPSVPAAVIFVVLFSLATIYHTFLVFKHKTWYFIPFLIGCVFEVVGFVGRTISATETPNQTLAPYVIQTLLTLLGPTLFAASIYMVLGRLVRLLEAEKYSLIRSTWLTKVFVFGDVLSFLTQAAGGAMLAQADSAADQDRGKMVILIGLGIQVVFFGLFILVTIIFHVRIAHEPTPRSYAVTAPWKGFLYVLYASSVLIMVRSVYRMVEYAMGRDGPLMTQEVWVFLLDATLMFLVTACFAWFHPHRIISGYKTVERQTLDVEEARSESYLMVPDGAAPAAKNWDSNSSTRTGTRSPETYHNGNAVEARSRT